jgi:hypothetical protein
MNIRLRWKKIGPQHYEAQIDELVLRVMWLRQQTKKKWIWLVFDDSSSSWEHKAGGYSMSRNRAQQTARKAAQSFLE